jgi:hypothetical protein
MSQFINESTAMPNIIQKNHSNDSLSCPGTLTFIPHKPVMTFKGTKILANMVIFMTTSEVRLDALVSSIEI